MAMHTYAHEFANTVGLFEQVRQMDAFASTRGEGSAIFAQWAAIAAKAGIVSLYNYRMALDGIHRGRRQCRMWSPLIDHKAVEAAQERFRADFPHTTELRQSLLHAVERYSNEERQRRNALKKRTIIPGLMDVSAGTSLTGSGLLDNLYVATWEGGSYSYELSGHSILKLKHIAELVFTAFAKIVDRAA